MGNLPKSLTKHTVVESTNNIEIFWIIYTEKRILENPVTVSAI